MTNSTGVSSSEVRGYSMLAFDAAAGLVGLVESMHHNIARASGFAGTPSRERMSGVSGWVYRGVRGAIRLAGRGIDAPLRQLAPLLGEASLLPRPRGGARGAERRPRRPPGRDRQSIGDPDAPAPRRTLRCGWTRRRSTADIPPPNGPAGRAGAWPCAERPALERKGHDHGAALARDLGYTPVYLHYNSGLHISDKRPRFRRAARSAGRPMAGAGGGAGHHRPQHGRAGVAQRLPLRRRRRTCLAARICASWSSSARRTTARRWSAAATGSISLLGKSPYTAPFTRLGRMRSAGITDLRYGNLLDEDWQGRDRFEHEAIGGAAVPLPEGVECFAIAATTGNRRRRPS